MPCVCRGRKSKAGSGAESKLLLAGRDDTYSIFHSIGKILHAKRARNILCAVVTHLLLRRRSDCRADCRSLRFAPVFALQHSAVLCLLTAGLDPLMFSEFLHANYIDHLPLDDMDWCDPFLSSTAINESCAAIAAAAFPRRPTVSARRTSSRRRRWTNLAMYR